MDIFAFSVQAISAMDLQLVATSTVGFTQLHVLRRYPKEVRTSKVCSGSYDGLSPEPARVRSVLPLIGPLDLSGKVLSILIDERTPVNIQFAGVAVPYTLPMVVADITAAAPTVLFADVDERGKLTIATQATGLQHTIRVLPGSANTVLCLPEVFATGCAPAIPLHADVRQYVVSDPWYLPGTEYTYYAAGPGGNTQPTIIQPWERRNLLPPEVTVKGVGTFLDTQGVPVRKGQVSFYMDTPYKTSDTSMVIPYEETVPTSDEGSFAIQLLRGATYTYSVIGMPIVGSFKVPLDPSIDVVDVLSSRYGEAFVFTVQRPVFPVAERTRL